MEKLTRKTFQPLHNAVASSSTTLWYNNITTDSAPYIDTAGVITKPNQMMW